MNTIQSLWLQSPLGTMQTLSLRSFVASGHPVTLYTYDAGLAQAVPRGVQVLDANVIVPASELKRFKYAANFSDYFRYRLLFEKGGAWTDLDMVALKPFTFDGYVFASEDTQQLVPEVSSAFIQVPAGSALIEAALNKCQSIDPMQMGWADMGPKLLHSLVHQFRLQQFVKSTDTFCSLPWWNVRLLTMDYGFKPPADAVGLHLWNSCWSQLRMNPEGSYSENSLYEKLKARYA